MKNRIYKRDIPRYLAANANAENLLVTFYDPWEVVVVNRGKYQWVKRPLTRIAQRLALRANEWAYHRLMTGACKAVREAFRQPELRDDQIRHAIGSWARATRFYHKTPKHEPAIVEV